MLSHPIDRWVSSLLEEAIPDEPLATCAACPLAESRGAERPAFDPTTKCCTYVPVLPNYLVGMILGDDAVALDTGRESVVERIARGVEVTPLGLGRPAVYQMIYEAVADGPRGAFGKSPALRCPHYLLETGGCGIWQYRNGVCATWFCRHGRGDVGMRFWRQLRGLITAIESGVSRFCARRLGLDTPALAARLNNSSRGQVLDEVLGRPAPDEEELWRAWGHDKQGYYRACADIASKINGEDLLGIGGADLALQLSAVQKVLEEHGRPTPKGRLSMGSFQLESCGDEHVLMTSYSPYDVVRMSVTELAQLANTVASASTKDALLGGPTVERLLAIGALRVIAGPDAE